MVMVMMMMITSPIVYKVRTLSSHCPFFASAFAVF